MEDDWGGATETDGNEEEDMATVGHFGDKERTRRKGFGRGGWGIRGDAHGRMRNLTGCEIE